MSKAVTVRQTIYAFLMGTALTAGTAWAGQITAPTTVDPGQKVQIQVDSAVEGGSLELWGPVTNASTGGQIATWPLTGPSMEIAISEGPGSYQLRQTAPDGSVLSKKLIDVAAAAVTLRVPDTATAGAELALTWEGAGQEGAEIVILDGSTGQPVATYPASTPNGELLAQAPERTGYYRVAYQVDGTVLLDMPIEVVAGGGWLRSPLTVETNQEFGVEWVGAVGEAKTVRIVTEDDKELYAQVAMSGTRQGPGKATIFAPADPGRYLIQIIDDATGKSVTDLPLIVDPT
ncbi:MAG: hypothetical protein AAF557_05025 [Pseudomonadota bacterium]